MAIFYFIFETNEGMASSTWLLNRWEMTFLNLNTVVGANCTRMAAPSIYSRILFCIDGQTLKSPKVGVSCPHRYAYMYVSHTEPIYSWSAEGAIFWRSDDFEQMPRRRTKAICYPTIFGAAWEASCAPHLNEKLFVGSLLFM